MFGIAGSLIGDVWSLNPETRYMELSFLAAVETTTLGTPVVIVGGRNIDLSVLPDGSRKVYFVAALQSGAAAAVAHAQLWDVTHDVLIAELDNSAAFDPYLSETFVSAQLTEGSSDGDVRTDEPTEYEIRIYRSGGLSTDLIGCLNAHVRVVYD